MGEILKITSVRRDRCQRVYHANPGMFSGTYVESILSKDPSAALTPRTG